MTVKKALQYMEQEQELAKEMLDHNQATEGSANQYLSDKVEWLQMAMDALKKK